MSKYKKIQCFCKNFAVEYCKNRSGVLFCKTQIIAGIVFSGNLSEKNEYATINNII